MKWIHWTQWITVNNIMNFRQWRQEGLRAGVICKEKYRRDVHAIYNGDNHSNIHIHSEHLALDKDYDETLKLTLDVILIKYLFLFVFFVLYFMIFTMKFHLEFQF